MENMNLTAFTGSYTETTKWGHTSRTMYGGNYQSR